MALVLYIGCETTPRSYRKLEKSRVLSVEQADIQSLLQDAKSHLPPAKVNQLESLERELDSASDSNRVGLLQQLSGQWFQLEQYAIAGHYAQVLAEQVQDGNSWSIAGATYAIGVQRSEAENIKDFCAGRAVQAFESAISLEPEVIPHKINLALVYAERPQQDNPMKGIQMLLELDRTHPDNAGVLFHLGRLAMRTGQYERAVERLGKVTALAPERKEAFCLLAEAYEALGDAGKASAAKQKCSAEN